MEVVREADTLKCTNVVRQLGESLDDSVGGNSTDVEEEVIDRCEADKALEDKENEDLSSQLHCMIRESQRKREERPAAATDPLMIPL